MRKQRCQSVALLKMAKSCKPRECRTCPYRTYEKSDIFRTTPVCQYECEDRKIVVDKRKDK